MTRARYRIAVAMAALVLGGFAPSAHALFGRHKSDQPRAMRRAKKNTSPYAYLAPKKQKKNTSPYAYLAPKKQKKSSGYRNTLTGEMVNGSKKKK